MIFKKLSKSNLYGRFLIVMVLLFFTYVFTSESIFLFNNAEAGPKYAAVIIGALNLFYFFFAIRILEVLNVNQPVVKTLWGYFFISIFVTLFLTNPFIDILDEEIKPFTYAFFHALNIVIELFLSTVILRDIFMSDETHSDHIWGAVTVYFLAVIIFGELYEIITLMHPGLLGEVYNIGWYNYSHCIVYSLNAVSGLDMIHSNAHPFLRKIAIAESIFGNLFLIVILGRLLSNPVKNRNK